MSDRRECTIVRPNKLRARAGDTNDRSTIETNRYFAYRSNEAAASLIAYVDHYARAFPFID